MNIRLLVRLCICIDFVFDDASHLYLPHFLTTTVFNEVKIPPRVGWDGVVSQILDSATDAEQVHHVLEDVFGDDRTGKSALVLFHLINSCVQYDVLVIWPLHLTSVYLYLIVL